MHVWQFVSGRKYLYKAILEWTRRGCSCQVEASKAVSNKTCQVRIEVIAFPNVRSSNIDADLPIVSADLFHEF